MSERSLAFAIETHKNGVTSKVFFNAPADLSDHLKEAEKSDARRLYLLQGLPIDYVQVLGSHFDINPIIFDSHACRKSGQLHRGLERRKIAQAFALDYPEAVTSKRDEHPDIDGDIMLPCQTVDILGDDSEQKNDETELKQNLKIQLCHVTVVSLEKKANRDGNESYLLILESSSTNNQGLSPKPFISSGLTSRALQHLTVDKRHWNPAFNDELMMTMKDRLIKLAEDSDIWLDCTCEIFLSRLNMGISDLIIQQWAELLETIPAVPVDGSPSKLKWRCFHLLCNLLDSNLRMHMIHRQNEGLNGFQTKFETDEWTRLLKRAKRNALMSLWGMAEDKADASEDKDEDEDEDTDTSSKANLTIRGGALEVDNETKQSINRVTYLGGVLLPFSIVAGIFSMGGDYQPGGEQFFIFWTVAIPVCILTTAVIYADSIRRMTVEQFTSQYGGKVEYTEEESIAESASSRVDVYSEIRGVRPWGLRLGRGVGKFLRVERLNDLCTFDSDGSSSHSAWLGGSESTGSESTELRRFRSPLWRLRNKKKNHNISHDIENVPSPSTKSNLESKLADHIKPETKLPHSSISHSANSLPIGPIAKKSPVLHPMMPSSPPLLSKPMGPQIPSSSPPLSLPIASTPIPEEIIYITLPPSSVSEEETLIEHKPAVGFPEHSKLTDSKNSESSPDSTPQIRNDTATTLSKLKMPPPHMAKFLSPSMPDLVELPPLPPSPSFSQKSENRLERYDDSATKWKQEKTNSKGKEKIEAEHTKKVTNAPGKAAMAPPDSQSGRSKVAPLLFTDCVGRKFTFPFHLACTWAGMEDLINSTSLHVEGIGPQVKEGHYDLVGPDGTIILPQIWESLIEPGWKVSQHMWPPLQSRPVPGPPPPPPGMHNYRPRGHHGRSEIGGMRPGPPPTSHRGPPTRPPPGWSGGPPQPPPGFSQRIESGFTEAFGGVVRGSSRSPPPEIIKIRRDKTHTQTKGVLSWMAGKSHSSSAPVGLARVGKSTRLRTSAGARDVGRKGDEEMGWARAFGTIVGLKPEIEKAGSIKSESGISLADD